MFLVLQNLAVFFLFAVFAQTWSFARTNGQEAMGQATEGKDFLQQDPNLSARYQRGPFLIYDCDSRHWVCAGKAERDRCQNWRQEGLAKREKRLACAFFVSFDSEKACQKKQLQMIENAGAHRFCLHPEARKREIAY